jgi:hypothetical protein
MYLYSNLYMHTYTIIKISVISIYTSISTNRHIYIYLYIYIYMYIYIYIQVLTHLSINSNIGSSEELLKVKAEMVEITDRCTNLRTMNEELITMLEAMHEKK